MEMHYIPFGRTGVQVSPLCLGCWMFGARTPEDQAHAIVAQAWEAGINFIDTANVYSRGLSEEILGRALAKLGIRERVVLATKVHFRMDDADPNAAGNSRRHVIQQCEASLRRLGTDWIDLYQLHRPDPHIPLDETLRALDDLIRAGKVRYVGTSTFAAWQLMEAIMVARELGANRFVSEQPPYHLLDRRIERELLPFCRTYATAVMPWSPLAGGFLTGKYRRGEPWPEDTRFTESAEKEKRKRDHFADAYDVLDVVLEMVREKSCTPSQLALAWVRSRPGITCPIMGPRTPEQLTDNLGSLGVTITQSDSDRLDAVAPPGRVLVPFYDADFGPHPNR